MACPGPIAKPGCLAARRFLIDAGVLFKVRNRLRQRHRAGSQTDVDTDSSRAVAHQVDHLFASARIVFVQAFAHQHLFTIKGPAFGEDAVALHVAHEVRIMIRVGELHEMARDSLVAEQRQDRLARLCDEEALIGRAKIRHE